MAEGILMPKAGITVESCIIGEWFKKVGDKVSVGDILFSYETDKAVFECESTAAGEILEIFYQKGDEVPCLVNVCAVGTPGEDISALRPAGAESTAPAAEALAAPAAEAPAATVQVEVQQTASSDGAVHASPRAKGLAERSGMDVSLAAPTGPDGRIIERDVRRLMEEGVPAKAAAAQTAAAAPAAPAAPAEPEYEDVKFSGIRRAIAKSMTESLSSMAQLTNHFSFDAGKILAYRKELKATEGDTAKIT
ncbi:MAG: biotin/lipoyl-containing protein, partial [Oscillospiraceae bacterium]